MTIRPALKTLLINGGLLVFAICAFVAIMQVHLRYARDTNAAIVAASGSMVSAVNK